MAIPEDIALQNLNLEVLGFTNLSNRNYPHAACNFEQQYNLLLERQKKDSIRIHKGGPAHNLGVSLLYLGNSQEGLWWLLVAFSEDVLSESKEFGSDDLPASRVLRGILGVSQQDLDILRKYIFKEKRKEIILDATLICKELSAVVGPIVKASEEYALESFKLETQGSKYLLETNYIEAEKIYIKLYALLNEFQNHRKIRLHKGHVIFQIAYSQLRQNIFDKSIINHRLAYIEDVISEREIGDATATAAFQNLKNTFHVSLNTLSSLEEFVQTKMLTSIPEHPEEVYEEFLIKNGSFKETEQDKEIELNKKFNISRPPGDLEKRVFIGGDYVLMPILREIKKVVVEKGFQPIMASDFEIPEDKTNDYCCRLVEMCKYAIFEVTIDGGQLIELQTARVSSADIRIKTIYMAQDEQKATPKTMTSLVKTNPTPEGYVTLEELNSIASKFLSENS